MPFDPALHHRRSIRLRGYDYSGPGAYCLTICTRGKRHLVGEIVEGEMQLNPAGKMVEHHWSILTRQFGSIRLDEFVVMPNHLHGIIVVVGAPLVGARDACVGAALVAAQPGAVPNAKRAGTRPAPTIGDIVGAFKSVTTHEYIRGLREFGWPAFTGALWQRNYYEHIICNDAELDKIREYIRTNPLR